MLKAELDARRRTLLAADELLRRCYTSFRCRDSVAHLRKELSCFSASKSDVQFDVVNHQHSLLEGNTLANLSARCGALRCLQELVQNHGSRLDVPDNGGFTPLVNAAWRGDEPMVCWLLARGADVAVRGTSRGRGPADAATWARWQGHDDVAATIDRHVLRQTCTPTLG